jgi:hypothetical protein
VLDGFELRTDVHTAKYPDRYMDTRGAVMWAPIAAAVTIDVADINPARVDPGGDWSPVAMDRPAQAGARAGRHRRGASGLLFLFSNHYGTPDQCGSDNR